MVLSTYKQYIPKRNIGEIKMAEASVFSGGGLTPEQANLLYTYQANTGIAPMTAEKAAYAGINNTGAPFQTESETYNPTTITPQYSAAQLGVRDSVNTSLSDLLSSATSAAGKKGNQTNAFNTGNSWLEAQKALNKRAQQNELNRKVGGQDILSMISKGLQSGGRMLASGNAGSSSAAGELAKIYSKIGQGEMSKIGNQYGLADMAIGEDQATLNKQQDDYMNVDFANQKEDIIAGIVDSARTALTALNESLVGASLPDRIAIESEIAKIKGAAQGELAKVDQMLVAGRDTARGAMTSADANRAKAIEMMQMGQAPASQFDYTTTAPVNWQGNQGPAGGNLPIFTFPRNKRQVA